MKQLIIAIVCLVTFNSVAQTVTTKEEYNYLTKGYEEDLEAGRNIKDGYTLDKFYAFDNDSFNHSYYLFKETATNTVKAVLIVNDKNGKEKTRYLCLPFNNKDLFKDFFKDYESLGISMGISMDVSVFNLLQGIIQRMPVKG